MTTQAAQTAREEDQRITFHGVTWDRYGLFLAIRGDNAGIRVTYMAGELELMTPSGGHEWVKKTIGRLLEAYAAEKELVLEGYGSWTLRAAVRAVGVEPDECYMLGPIRKERPDLAIEVAWTPGGLDKLEIYARLKVPEVWIWSDGAITVHVLEEGGFVVAERSRVFPELDIRRFATFLDRPTQTEAVRELVEWLRSGEK